MRHLIGIAALLAALLATAPATADNRTPCVAACESTAAACAAAGHATYDACKPAANKGCAATSPADKFKCLTTALQACTTTRSAATSACHTAFKSCHAACGAAPEGQAEFWCTLDADNVASNVKVRKTALCSGTPGTPPQDQHDACIKRFMPTDPSMGFSLDCELLP